MLLSEQEKEIQLTKSADIIWNPFAVDCNDRKILTRLHQMMKEQSDDYFLEKVGMLTSGIIDYLDAIAMTIPYPLDYSVDLDCQSLYKLFDVKIDFQSEDYRENLLNYIKIRHQICRSRLFIFVALKTFFTAQQLEELYEDLKYEKICLLDIENVQKSVLSCEKTILLDKDCCLIELN